MKTTKQLNEMGFIFTTHSTGLISARLLDEKLNTLFATKAITMATIRRRIAKYLAK